MTFGIGDIVNNIVIPVFGVRWVLDLLGWPLSKLYSVQSLRYTPKTNESNVIENKKFLKK